MLSLRSRILAVLAGLFAALFVATVALPGAATAQVITVPDVQDLPPRPRLVVPRHPDCPRGQICTVCFAGCGGSGQSTVVFHTPTPPSPPVSKDPPVPNAHLAGANRHPGSHILCGKQGTCRGFGMRDEDSYWTRGWHYNDMPVRPYYYVPSNPFVLPHYFYYPWW